ncbi:MAG: alpha/beta fold hydrolase [Porticoccaceae bacterium]|nr:alpha/beta fold hydrolase [Porticoccaceae bacterium]
MAYIDRNGVKIYYDIQGPQGALPILLSHGHAAATQMWAGQVEALKQQFRIITWDLRGHGRSDCPTDPALYSVEHTVDDIAAILDACGIDKAVIGGHSLGGVMSFQFQLKYPDRVLAMTILNSGPGFRSDSTRDKWNLSCERTASSLERKGLSALSKSDEVHAEWHSDVWGLIHSARGIMTHQDARMIDELGNIDVPVLVLVGAQDKEFLGAGEYMARKIPNVQKKIIEDAGHAANLDQPEIFNQLLINFLAQFGDRAFTAAKSV